MSRHRSIRQRLLTDQILLILLLGGGIMATTFLGARRAVETLSRAVITRAADQAEGELRRFFDPVAGALEALGTWAEGGLVDVGDLLHRHRRAGAAEILAAIRAALREFTGDAPLDDDRTAVIVKRTA